MASAFEGTTGRVTAYRGSRDPRPKGCAWTATWCPLQSAVRMPSTAGSPRRRKTHKTEKSAPPRRSTGNSSVDFPPPLALTVRQPWASLIAAGLKTIENRSWERRSVLGKRIAIHAAKGAAVPVELRGRAGQIAQVDNPRGAIVCTAVVKRFITSSRSPWFVGPIGWVLANVRSCAPIYCSGALGLWRIPPRTAVRLRLNRKAGKR